MAFWGWLFGDTPNHAGVTPNSNGPSNWTPGDPDGVTVETPDPVELRSFPVVMPSPWMAGRRTGRPRVST